MTRTTFQWHPPFFATLQIEFEEELDKMMFENEHQLSKKPMAIDALIIKKEKGVIIKKNIGRLFREYNIIEYKDPNDYVSINDFYKVCGYTCFYQADTDRVMEIEPDQLTITFICNRKPKKLWKHLESRKITVEKQEPGIYYLKGHFFPIQVLVTHELSRKENLWLNSLRTDLDPKKEIKELIEEYEKHRKSPQYEAAMNIIIKANQRIDKEDQDMCEALRELFAEELEESKKLAEIQGEIKGEIKGQIKGEIQGKINIIQKIMIKREKGQSAEQSAEALEELSYVREVYGMMERYSDYSAQQIFEELDKIHTLSCNEG